MLDDGSAAAADDRAEGAAAEQSAKLPWKVRIAYGIGDNSGSVILNVLAYFLLEFLLNVAKLKPSMAGNVVLISKFLDALSDPTVGVLSDKTQSRWGRRRPWLMFAPIPLAIAYFCLWLVPTEEDTLQFAYYLGMLVLVNTFFTCVVVPHAALTPELTSDYHERTVLSAVKTLFTIFMGVLVTVVHSRIIDRYQGDEEEIECIDGVPVESGISDSLEKERSGFLVSAAVMSIFIIIPPWITAWVCRESGADKSQVRTPTMADVKDILTNRAFVVVTVVFIASFTSLVFVQNHLLLYVELVLDFRERFTGLVATVQGTMIISLLFWAVVSRRIGKVRVYHLGMTLSVVALLGAYGLDETSRGLTFLFFFVGAFGLSTGLLVPFSLLPDVLDADELRCGLRREGIFYGLFIFGQKLSLGTSIAISGYVLEAMGYKNGDCDDITDQPEAVLDSLRFMLCIVPVMLLTIAMGVITLFPITEESHAETMKQLAESRRGKEMQSL